MRTYKIIRSARRRWSAQLAGLLLGALLTTNRTSTVMSAAEDRHEIERLRETLLALYLRTERIAVNGNETCTYPGGIFNDKIWREASDGGFRAAKAARDALGLRAFSYKNKIAFGVASEALAKFRSKAS